MKVKRNILFYGFSSLCIIALSYCLLAYRYLQPLLNFDLVNHTLFMTRIELMIIPALMIVGFYHIHILVNVLKVLPYINSKLFFHSLYVVLIILSGVLLISDVTLLSDIGKEYHLWDVSKQWSLLYGLTCLHSLTAIIGFIYGKKYYKKGGIKTVIREIKEGNDILFLSFNQIALICGIFGLLGVGLSLSINMLDFYRASLMFILSVIALLPLMLFSIYWILKNRKKSILLWLDEKQFADTCIGALISLATGMVILGIAFFLTVSNTFVLDEPFLLSLLFFIQLTVFSGIISIRNNDLINN